MRESPTVSVVVPALNAAPTIGDMLNGLASQVGRPNHTEIIVVDGGSTDGTQEIVRRFDVRLLEELKRGPATARNLGLHEASGDVIAHLDADAIPTRRWLAELVSPFQDPQVILAAGNTLSYPPETPAQRFAAAIGLHTARPRTLESILPIVPSVNMAVRREAALTIGGWRGELLTAEDIDFCFRLLRKFPSKIAYASDARVLHRNRRTDEGLRAQAWTYGEGAGHIYLLYPDLLPWKLSNSIKVARIMALRTAKPALLRMGKAVGLTTHEEVEYALYHKLWTSWYWRGFFSMLRNREYRNAPGT